MNDPRGILIAVLIGAAALMAAPFDALAQPRRPGPPPPCAPPHKMTVEGLDMTPDPVHQTQPLTSWIVTLKSDQNGECNSRIAVRDRNEVAGLGLTGPIRPGTHQYTIPVRPGYRFQGQDHCFLVLVDLAGTPPQQVDARGTFCAKFKPPAPGKAPAFPSWTLK